MPIKSNNVDETGEQKIRSHFLLDLPDAQCEKITQKVSFFNIIELAVKLCYQTDQYFIKLKLMKYAKMQNGDIGYNL